MSRNRSSRSASPCVSALLVCLLCATDVRAGFTPFKPGDVVVATDRDSNSLSRFDRVARQLSPLATGGLLTSLRGLSFAPDDTLYVGDQTNGILQLDSTTGVFRRTNINLRGDEPVDLVVA